MFDNPFLSFMLVCHFSVFQNIELFVANILHDFLSLSTQRKYKARLFKILIFSILPWGVLQYDFYLFATLLQVATIIYYYFLLFLLNLNILSVYHTEQYTCTTINRCHTTLYRIICKMF